MENAEREKVTIELMKLEDLDRVIEIEKLSFTNPWSRNAFAAELTDNHFSTYIVAKFNGSVVGYAGMWLVVDEAHVTNVAVLPEYRGRGIGELLMRSLMDIARGSGARRMTLEVRKSNYVAQNLYSKLGFEPMGIRPGYYSDNREDAVIMWADLLEK
ncbi:ribosomal protein S18-alanine N-acetyltransferase [Thermosediminibacter oceani]|uniref:(SSU ribosomal protein S18P)-alanine acetyltransferase n=1 Tax=Thermosediminibacter oceani (strain ATCC BAA-1034 / DSM 16646 / JW/IW-1228P) TaxID=555079 RepID=D9RZ67_THEOJ|nr:ribosomal protein S18-alanine N-acetyltransferase [Thermosediminibacter oceani]ADL08621.1 (SSU ribosomal protein S18P)-alanine acetyltransferase [Thermosediminibacter oceani DSM 16646]